MNTLNKAKLTSNIRLENVRFLVNDLNKRKVFEIFSNILIKHTREVSSIIYDGVFDGNGNYQLKHFEKLAICPIIALSLSFSPFDSKLSSLHITFYTLKNVHYRFKENRKAIHFMVLCRKTAYSIHILRTLFLPRFVKCSFCLI